MDKLIDDMIGDFMIEHEYSRQITIKTKKPILAEVCFKFPNGKVTEFKYMHMLEYNPFDEYGFTYNYLIPDAIKEPRLNGYEAQLTFTKFINDDEPLNISQIVI